MAEIASTSVFDPKSEGIKNAHDTEYDREIDRETRHLRFWILKVMVGSICACFIAIVFAIIYAYVIQNKSIEGSIIIRMLETIANIIDVLK